MITINHLKKAFGNTVACDIPELTINDGDILGLVGNNGAGKTTLFRMLLDLLKPDEGEVALDGINPAQSEEWKATTGAYIDEGFLIDFLTPEEYFAFIGKITNMTQEQVDERLKAFERLAGGEIFGQKKLIRNLSAGNKQKVGIISALFNHPKLVILDEPSAGLSPKSVEEMYEVLQKARETMDVTIVLIEQNVARANAFCDRCLLIKQGVIDWMFYGNSLDEIETVMFCD